MARKSNKWPLVLGGRDTMRNPNLRREQNGNGARRRGPRDARYSPELRQRPNRKIARIDATGAILTGGSDIQGRGSEAPGRMEGRTTKRELCHRPMWGNSLVVAFRYTHECEGCRSWSEWSESVS